jgi:hypothetical protein
VALRPQCVFRCRHDLGSRHLENWETETSRVSILSQAHASEKTEIGHALMSKRFSAGVSEGLKIVRP